MSTPQVITCKAAVAWGAGEALVIEEVEVSPPQPMEIRIKVVSTSLCRSDLSAWESHAIFPRIFGHEASGAHLEKATLVVLGLERMGLMHSDQKTRFSVKGEPVYDYCAVSSFSEYTVVHSGCAVKLSPLAPLEKICLLSCGVAASLGAAWNVADVSTGSTVVIFGLGTVGLSVAQASKLRGASRIIGVDNNPQKCENAFGVTEVIKCITDGRADFSFECGWGLTVTLGVPKVKLEMSARYGLLLMGRTLKGSLFWGWKPKSDLPSLVKKYLNKEIQIDDYITHNLPFDDINKAFNLMKEGKYDIILLGESREELNERLETWRRALETHGFRLSRSKSEYMECKFNKRRRVSNSEVKIGDHIIPQVTRFKYLGSVIQDDGEIDGDVNHRIQAGWMKWRKASGVLCDAKVPIKLKGKFYRTAVRPAILYGTECWAVKSQHENKVGVAEMRMLRWMCGKTRQDKIRNEAIRERVGVAPIVEKMVENRLRWFGHVERRPVDSVVRRVDQMERRQTIRGRGRPKKTIREVIKKDLEINGLDRSMVLDRTLWRKLIHVADPT
ncbi:Alcohol dehydrogenase-like 6 [Glycine soja]|uniref:Alcohol dehydrogenase-like 6 n=1 Tax=Glycine soja TaxID=3848 RepID=A0A445GHX6_GLYSO|nr:Alcohol dehydrogenase-like 6 [Glycine soja]